LLLTTAIAGALVLSMLSVTSSAQSVMRVQTDAGQTYRGYPVGEWYQSDSW
jgi:hypothetical protein